MDSVPNGTAPSRATALNILWFIPLLLSGSFLISYGKRGGRASCAIGFGALIALAAWAALVAVEGKDGYSPSHPLTSSYIIYGVTIALSITGGIIAALWLWGFGIISLAIGAGMSLAFQIECMGSDGTIPVNAVRWVLVLIFALAFLALVLWRQQIAMPLVCAQTGSFLLTIGISLLVSSTPTSPGSLTWSLLYLTEGNNSQRHVLFPEGKSGSPNSVTYGLIGASWAITIISFSWQFWVLKGIWENPTEEDKLARIARCGRPRKLDRSDSVEEALDEKEDSGEDTKTETTNTPQTLSQKLPVQQFGDSVPFPASSAASTNSTTYSGPSQSANLPPPSLRSSSALASYGVRPVKFDLGTSQTELNDQVNLDPPSLPFARRDKGKRVSTLTSHRPSTLSSFTAVGGGNGSPVMGSSSSGMLTAVSRPHSLQSMAELLYKDGRPDSRASHSADALTSGDVTPALSASGSQQPMAEEKNDGFGQIQTEKTTANLETEFSAREDSLESPSASETPSNDAMAAGTSQSHCQDIDTLEPTRDNGNEVKNTPSTTAVPSSEGASSSESNETSPPSSVEEYQEQQETLLAHRRSDSPIPQRLFSRSPPNGAEIGKPHLTEAIVLSQSGSLQLSGSIVASSDAVVTLVWTNDGWSTTHHLNAEADGEALWTWKLEMPSANKDKKFECCVKASQNGIDKWDNNNGSNFKFSLTNQ